jgi:hypothetical protein
MDAPLKIKVCHSFHGTVDSTMLVLAVICKDSPCLTGIFWVAPWISSKTRENVDTNKTNGTNHFPTSNIHSFIHSFHSMWRGANQCVTKKHRSHRRHRRENVENVEAILQRLRKGYAAAMDCVAAMHRLRTMTAATAAATSNDQSNDHPSWDLEQLRQVMHVARTTFENVILNDPIVQTLIPMLAKRMRGSQSKNTALVGSSSGWTSLSASHQKIIQEIVYLTLVNYADLLMAGLPASSSMQSTATSLLLDRGVIQHIPSISADNPEQTIWLDTNSTTPTLTNISVVVSETYQRIVAAYLDAVALDASDPTVYLKLAFAARKLDRIRTRRLQRHALERAKAGILYPWQNRTAQRAWNEFQQEEEQNVQFQIFTPSPQEDTTPPPAIVINLPRDSWLTMTRLVLRTCTNLTSGNATASVVSNHSKDMSTTSPRVQIYLSPLIGLSTSIWARIFPYLDVPSRNHCEMTCRALHTQLLLARAKIANEIDASQRLERQRQRLQQQQSTADNVQNPESQPHHTPALPRTVATSMDSIDGNNHTSNNHSLQPSVSDADTTEALSTGGQKRVSKRVRSQLITSGKRTERSYRRNSVEFCLLAATLGGPQRLDQFTRLRWRWGKIVERNESGAPTGTNEKKTGSWTTTASPTTASELAIQKGSVSSLTSFVQFYFPQDSGKQRPMTPSSCLFTILAHVSMHVDQVFSSEPGGTASLTSCLLECKFVWKELYSSIEQFSNYWQTIWLLWVLNHDRFRLDGTTN